MSEYKNKWITKKQLIDLVNEGKIDCNEAIIALEVMDNKGHSHAHFGLNGGFIYSDNKVGNRILN